MTSSNLGFYLFVCGLCLCAQTASAHLILNSPNGGEELSVGAEHTIEWEIEITHETLNWDLWYSTTGADGPWIEIATDVPMGVNEVGAVYTFDWTVPNTPSGDAFVRVLQDNEDMDWDDISEESFSIVAPAGLPGDYNNDGTVNAADYAVWRDAMHSGEAIANDQTPESVSASDFDVWRNQFGATAAAASQTVGAPEPSAFHLVALMCALCLGAVPRKGQRVTRATTSRIPPGY